MVNNIKDQSDLKIYDCFISLIIWNMNDISTDLLLYLICICLLAIWPFMSLYKSKAFGKLDKG